MVPWPHCLWASGETVYHDGEHMAEETAHLIVAKKQKER
jgi:hypothetical protein